MTLPFRGRHHDQESSHDRARALASAELIQPLDEQETSWLAGHLEACAECRGDREGFIADHDLLQALRENVPQPPRDLWARTAAAIEKESHGRRRGLAGAAGARRSRWGGAPIGVAAAALVVVVVVASGISRGLIPTVVPPASAGVAVASPTLVPPPPQPTPLTLTAAGDIGYVRPAANGRWELVISEVGEVCPKSRKGCEPLGEGAPRSIDLGGTPTGVTMSPHGEQLVVQSDSSASQPGKVFVVPLGSSAPPASEQPPTAAPLESPTTSPRASVIVVPSATPGSTPSGAIEIASDVTMVGEAAYSENGAWLAFSARPADDSAGPDLYLWHVGDTTPASAVTTDHATYFSSWLGNQVLASHVVVPAVETPGASGEPGTPEATTEATPGPSPEASPDGSAAPLAFHPVSFLLDPATNARTPFTQPDVWLPVVDAARRVTASWSGTLVPTADGLDWQLGEGQLVLDRWVEPGAGPSPSEPAAASSDPSTEPAADPSASPSTVPLEVVGPAGSPVSLDIDDVRVFKALFDPEGTRLAVWAADDPGAEVGRLHLLVIDPAAATIDAGLTPLPGSPALRRFSVDKGRLAWVSPRGQDGQESAVQVLGWEGRNFGEIKTLPAKDLFIVR